MKILSLNFYESLSISEESNNKKLTNFFDSVDRETSKS